MYKKKVLFIANSSTWSGAAIALYNLISILRDRFEIKVVVPRSGVLCSKLESIGVNCFIVSYSLTIWPVKKRRIFRIPVKTIFRNFLAKKKIGKILDDYKPDLVHTNVGPLDLALKECQKRGIPHVWHLREYQDLDFDLHFFPSKRNFLKKIRKKGNFNIAITKNIFEYWKLRPNIDTVVYDGVINVDNQVRTDIGFENYFLFVGRVEPAKGLLIVLKAFARYIEKRTIGLLLVAGSTKCSTSYYEECLKYVRDHNIMRNVVFLGERNDVYGLMSKAQAMIVASRFEGFGFITAEAMYNECLVIGKNTAGTKEQFDLCKEKTGQEVGLRFDGEDSLLDALELVESKSFEKERKLGKYVVMQNYTIDICVENITSYYEKIWNLTRNGT